MSDFLEYFLRVCSWTLDGFGMVAAIYLVCELHFQECLKSTHVQQANAGVIQVRYYNLALSVGWFMEHMMRGIFLYLPYLHFSIFLNAITEMFMIMQKFGLVTATFTCTCNICSMLFNLCDSPTPRIFKNYTKYIPIIAGCMFTTESIWRVGMKITCYGWTMWIRTLVIEGSWVMVMCSLFMIQRQLRAHETQMGGGAFIKRAREKMFKLGGLYTMLAMWWLYWKLETLFRPNLYKFKTIKRNQGVEWKNNTIIGMLTVAIAYHSVVRRPSKSKSTTTGS